MQEDIQQVITSYRQNLEYSAKDEDLLAAVNKAMTDSYDLSERMAQIAKKNKTMWQKGTNKDLERTHPKKAKITSNRIFTDIETFIPILTSESPEPTVIGDVDNNLQDTLQKGLNIAYEVKYKMQAKLQRMARHWAIYRLGALKYRWNKDKGFITENVLPTKLGFDRRAMYSEDLEYVFEELEDKIETLIEKFPKKKKEIQEFLGKNNPKSKVKYIEFWGGGGEWVCWKLQNIILDKKKNPNYNWEDETANVFEKPRFPYILLSVFGLDEETGVYDSTSLVEQTTWLQEGINQLEQQILDLNEGQKRVWVVSADAMSEAKAQDLVNKTGDLLCYLDRKSPAGGVGQVQSGKPDASLFNHLSHLLGEIDNTIGIHSTTRGERVQQETLGGRKLLMGSDYGRLDLIVRGIEQVVEEWYNGYLQMIKVYSIESEVLRNGKQVIEIDSSQIPTGIQVMVKKGSTLPVDRTSKRDQAIQLAQFGMIDPKTLFEEMGFPNVEQRVQDLYQWLQQTGKIQSQTSPQGPPGVIQGQSEGQLTRLNQILESSQFQQLPPQEQTQMVQRAREIVNQIKGQQ